MRHDAALLDELGGYLIEIRRLVEVAGKVDSRRPVTIKRRQSKRKSFSRLPANWRDVMAGRMRKPNRVAFLTECLTGCRPEELRRGIVIKLTTNDLGLIVKDPAKKGQSHGFTYSLGDETLVTLLVDLLKDDFDASGRFTVTIESPKTYSQCVKEAAIREFGEIAKDISAYSLHHAAASDFKASGMSQDEISIALGHTWGETKNSDGSYSQGRGASALRPKAVEGTKRVKNGPKHSPAPQSVKSKSSTAPKPSKARPKPSPFDAST